jgi:hypothetical protein
MPTQTSQASGVVQVIFLSLEQKRSRFPLADWANLEALNYSKRQSRRMGQAGSINL